MVIGSSSVAFTLTLVIVSFEQKPHRHSANLRVLIHSNKNRYSMHHTDKYLKTQLNHLVSLARRSSVCLWAKWLLGQVSLQSHKFQISRLY